MSDHSIVVGRTELAGLTVWFKAEDVLEVLEGDTDFSESTFSTLPTLRLEDVLNISSAKPCYYNMSRELSKELSKATSFEKHGEKSDGARKNTSESSGSMADCSRLLRMVGGILILEEGFKITELQATDLFSVPHFLSRWAESFGVLGLVREQERFGLLVGDGLFVAATQQYRQKEVIE